ncbi:MAG: DUF465 domain-containing protein [Alphaproteobacteria bacterium]|nr:DUF465 domain-containing protein [Alphaproteobacteria bacterium]
MNEDLQLIKRLEYMRSLHREMDEKIKETTDEFSRKRLQKEKLGLRDQIMRLEHLVYPDATA